MKLLQRGGVAPDHDDAFPRSWIGMLKKVEILETDTWTTFAPRSDPGVLGVVDTWGWVFVFVVAAAAAAD